jgi:hypothetical protein
VTQVVGDLGAAVATNNMVAASADIAFFEAELWHDGEDRLDAVSTRSGCRETLSHQQCVA